MANTISAMTEEVSIGNHAAWHLSFFAQKPDGKTKVIDDSALVDVGTAEYYGEIHATLPSGLEGGSYNFMIEGLADEHYKDLKDVMAGEDSLVVKLYLYWRDTTSVLGYLTSLAGLTDTFGSVKGKDLPDEFLVAVLKVTKVSRRVGSRRYETVIAATERIHSMVNSALLCKGSELDTTNALEELLVNAAKLGKDDYEFHGATAGKCRPHPTGKKGDGNHKLEKGCKVLRLLKTLGNNLQKQTGEFGRGMFLIRNGVLHVGTRPIPLDDKPAKKVTLANGLLQTEYIGDLVTDSNFNYCPESESNKPDKPLVRRQFRLTFKGRADLKPGDLIKFDSPPEEIITPGLGSVGVIKDLFEGPLVPSLGDTNFQDPVELYIESVDHKLGRATGFVTTVTGVEMVSGKEMWDCHTLVGCGDENEDDEEDKTTGANAETQAAKAVKNLVRRAVASKSFLEVGEVRQMVSSGADEPPGQTLSVWRGLEPADGEANAARRLAIQRTDPGQIGGVPYASPFAWGKCGLVLPRYPGTRSLLSHRNGNSNDPIDIGALWESGHGPDSRAGDWWLILPVGVDGPMRAKLADDQSPEEHNGQVTQDLIDADGNRVIEVGELTVRVGRADLKDAGQRPTRGEEDAVTVEHTGAGSKIIMRSDGTVIIEAGTNLELRAAEDILIQAQNVNVKVSGKMDVSDPP